MTTLKTVEYLQEPANEGGTRSLKQYSSRWPNREPEAVDRCDAPETPEVSGEEVEKIVAGLFKREPALVAKWRRY